MRSKIDFSKHEHRIEIFKCEDKEIRVDHFQVKNSRMLYIQFINTDEVLTVTGDFGNWVFCRPFVPSEKGEVSDHYWLEKLRMNSQQSFNELDFYAIIEDIKEKIHHGLEDYGYEGKDLVKLKEWYSELLDVAESNDVIEYEYKAFRDYKPNCLEYEDIPMYKIMPIQLNIIFDAFDEICKRMKHGKAM